MTFAELYAAVYEECNYTSSPATAVATRVKRYLNEGVRRTLLKPGLARLADSAVPYTFASVANTALYTVPEAVARILHITERTNDQALTVMDLAEYRHADPDPTTNTGTPTRYVPVGRVAVAVQPADASAVYVKSTSASDTGTAYIEGIRTGGVMGTASVTMTGATAAAVGSITDFVEITDFYLSANAVGTVTLYEDSGTGTVLATIPIGAKRPRYYGFYLWPTPSAAVTYYVDYRRRTLDMVQDTDEPPFHDDAHPLLIDYATWKEAQKTGDADRAVQAKQSYDDWIARLTYQTQTLSDEIPVAGRGRLVGRSRLGGMYPADIYVRG